MTDFMNLKIKPAQSFEDVRYDMYTYVYKGECLYVYEYLRLSPL
jgi:hypothetical protein